MLIESFVYSNFNYALYFGILRVQKQLIKLRVCMKERYDSYLTITKVLMTLFLWKQRNLQWRFKDLDIFVQKYIEQ